MDLKSNINTQADEKLAKTAKSPEKPAVVTPMMAQFLEIKAINPGYLLFYRMGDFYELFFEDAEIASKILGIVLTKRGKHQGKDIAMCGVPVHASQEYLRKLIASGQRVAVCEQMENPAEAKKRGAKSVVKRDVVRLVTPGTLTEDDLLPSDSNNFLGALAMVRHGDTDFALAWADISTGETFVADIEPDSLVDELGRLGLAELVIGVDAQQALFSKGPLPEHLTANLTQRDPGYFDSEQGAERIGQVFTRSDPTAFSRAGRAALGALLRYIAETQKNDQIVLRAPTTDPTNTHMTIDLATRASLELLVTNRGEAKGSLRHAIDQTVSAAGARLLARRLATPLISSDQINARLDMVQTFVQDSTNRDALRKALRSAPDLTRPLTRLGLMRGGPRDILHIGIAVRQAHKIADQLSQISPDLDGLPIGLQAIAQDLRAAPLGKAEEIERAIEPTPPLLARDANFVRENYHKELDAERRLASQSRAIIAELQARLSAETEIKSLKIKHNNVLGFFVEVPASHGQKLIDQTFATSFIHRQTMANAMRFTTSELADLEGQIARAQDTAHQIETEIFERLSKDILSNTAALRQTADAMAALDVTTALAHLADEQAYCRPRVDDSLAFQINGGRHPVVEQTLASQNQTFIVNDCDLSGQQGERKQGLGGQLWLVTGPNMGGKSTFLRQNALIAVLAQMGSFVPAVSAHLGIADKLFSRVGASDDIAQGRSTFMVEMVETAAILNRATSRSLVILDEIGRGTATFDGLSIAWATAEALHQTNACRALFATHFHELTALSNTMSRVSNHTMKVREWKSEVVFLHEVVEGAADRSYGIQVAKLAGLPNPVVERARQVLTLLEQQPTGQPGAVLEELPLFTHRPKPAIVAPDPVAELLDHLRPDDLTPRQAIETIYQLKNARDAHRRDH